MNKSSPGALSRRDFIKAGAAAGLGALLSTPSHPANEAAVGITSSAESQSGDKTLLEFKCRRSILSASGLSALATWALTMSSTSSRSRELKSRLSATSSKKKSAASSSGWLRRASLSPKAIFAAIGIFCGCASVATSTSSSPPHRGNGMSQSASRP